MHPSASACPVCGTPYGAQDAVCPGCGLVFGSHQPGVAPVPMPAPIVPLQQGQTLARGRFTIQRALSRGGMGALWLAVDHDAFDRIVVVKGLIDYFDRSDPAQVAVARQSFVREARTLAELRHPAIPQIFSYFEEDEQRYIVMEYIEGNDLERGLTRWDDETARLIPGKPYPRHRVVAWGIAVCRILEYLASRTPHPVVHHDIKPANLVLDPDSDSIWLVDFGTARTRYMLATSGVGAQQSSTYGTAGYAAPEQYRGQSEPRSDVYALAATLYHLLTDDDPRTHPFTFPQLDRLGKTGATLRPALHQDVASRITAAQLRAGLEAIPRIDPNIVAPDGSPLADRAALSVWCRANWAAARKWVTNGLAEAIMAHWDDEPLAEEVRTISTRYQNNGDLALDALLAHLDPQGYGSQQGQLTLDPPDVALTLPGLSADPQGEVTVTNSGQRYMEAGVVASSWLAATPARLGLAPGEQCVVTLRASASVMPQGTTEGVVSLTGTGGVRATAPVRLPAGGVQYPVWMHNPELIPLVVVGVLVVLMVAFVIVVGR